MEKRPIIDVGCRMVENIMSGWLSGANTYVSKTSSRAVNHYCMMRHLKFPLHDHLFLYLELVVLGQQLFCISSKWLAPILYHNNITDLKQFNPLQTRSTRAQTGDENHQTYPPQIPYPERFKSNSLYQTVSPIAIRKVNRKHSVHFVFTTLQSNNYNNQTATQWHSRTCKIWELSGDSRLEEILRWEPMRTWQVRQVQVGWWRAWFLSIQLAWSHTPKVRFYNLSSVLIKVYWHHGWCHCWWHSPG